MIGFAILIVLVVLSVPVMLIVALGQLSDIRTQLGELSVRVGALKAAAKTVKSPAVVVRPVPVQEPIPEPQPVREAPEPTPVDPSPECLPQEAATPHVEEKTVLETALERFWAKVEDWFCVRGDFAPAGMTREFAVATRWLTRLGAVLLVGATAYFLMLAIDKGWIGPTQRVVGMMFWGAVGIAGGVWLKLKSTRYSILGDVFAALGLVALYLSFGLGHRYFKPPVIASAWLAFAGLFAATVIAGVLSVRLKSLMIAVLALLGGFLVPVICSFTNHYEQLCVYLFVLSVGACAVAHFRRWTVYGCGALAISVLFVLGTCGVNPLRGGWTLYAFYALAYGLAIAQVVLHERRRGEGELATHWGFVACVGIMSTMGTNELAGILGAWCGARAVHFALWAVAHALLAVQSRKRGWRATPVLLVFAALHGCLALASAGLLWWHFSTATLFLCFVVLAGVLGELGVRYGERTLEAFALLGGALLALAGSLFLCEAAPEACRGTSDYLRPLVDRMQQAWSLPALAAYFAWRLGAPERWLCEIRKPLFVCTACMAFVLLTVESHIFGATFLPALRGGLVTIVWALTASALLSAGIVRRWKAIRLTGLGLLGLSALKVLFVDTASLATPARVAVFGAVGVLLIAGAFLYLKFKAAFEAKEAQA